MIACPNRATLQQWLADRAGDTAGGADDTHRSLVAHLEQCGHCQDVLAGLTDSVGGFLPAFADARGEEPSTRPTDAPIELTDYEVLERLGRGGMGVVHLARHRALNRHVAIKVLHPDLHARADLRERFVEEARIASQLQHPGVPPVHELGTLPDGRPYFVMKVVRGRTLAGLMAERPSPAADLPRFLAMFEQVCQAIAAAHGNGVLHRDLKPQNVMVGAFAEVQVMDWGLAKRVPTAAPGTRSDGASPGAETVTAGDADDADLTRHGTLLGTPAYMPPEQARGEAACVDRRSDVFGLGAILCEILTGKPPYKGHATDMLNQARSAALDPARTRLAASGAPPELIALAGLCLAAKPEDRPADGEAVAALVAAYRVGVEDRLRTAERERAAADVRVDEQRNRRRVLAMASGAVIAVLVLGAGIAGWQAVRATTAEGETATQLELKTVAEQAALAEANKARAAEATAIEREKEEQKARETAEAVAGFMREVFAQSGGYTQLSLTGIAKPNLTVKEAMDYAAKHIGGRFKDRPDIEAEVRVTIGQAYSQLGAFSEARSQLDLALAYLERARGPDHMRTLVVVSHLALVHLMDRQDRAAEVLLNRVLAGTEKASGQNHRDHLLHVSHLADLYRLKGDYAVAEPLFKRAITGLEKALGPDHPDILPSLGDMADLYRLKGDYAVAEPLFKRAITGLERLHEPDHPAVLGYISNLALLYQTKGDYKAAETLFKRALAGLEKGLGPDHPKTLVSAANLADLLKGKGDYAAAEPLLKRALAGLEKAFRPDHPITLSCVANLAVLYRAKRDYASAERLSKRALEGRERALGPNHEDTLRSINSLAFLYQTKGDYEAAEPLFKRALAGKEEVHGPRHPSTLTGVNNLGFLYYLKGDYAAAEPLLKRARDGWEAAFSPEHEDTLAAVNNLALLYLAKRDFGAARLHFNRALAGSEKAHGPDHPDTLESVNNLAFLDYTMKKYGAAVPLLERAARGFAGRPEMAGDVPFVRTHLGLSLLGDGKPAKAEPHLLVGHDWLTRQKTLAPQNLALLRQVLEGLVKVYAATNRPTEAAAWRAKLAALPPEVAPPPRLKQ